MIPSKAEVLHGSAVSLNGHAAVIIGKSGSGKSSLALALMALGAALVADDRCEVFAQKGRVLVRASATLPHLIEARGIGLLPVTLGAPTDILMVVDMDKPADTRLPYPNQIALCGVAVPLLAGQIGPHLGSSLFHILKTGHVPYHE